MPLTGGLLLWWGDVKQKAMKKCMFSFALFILTLLLNTKVMAQEKTKWLGWQRLKLTLCN